MGHITSNSCNNGKSESICHKLRMQIVTGRYLPGQQLPTYADMGRQFSAGRAVLQRAIETLKQDGFIRSVDRRGLYVVPNPPHLHQYGLLLASMPGELGWTRLTGALTREARRIEADNPFAQFRIHHSLQDPDTRRDVAVALRQDILAHRLAGLILTPKTFDLLHEEPLAELDIPAAALWSIGNGDSRATRINVDASALLKRALRHLKNAGRQHIAVLHMAETTTCLNHREVFSEAGIELHETWIQHIGRSHPQLAENVVRLIIDSRREIRPDGFVIADDSLLTSTLRGLHAAGMRPGQDCDIVAHANWPCEDARNRGITRIGFDIHDVLQRAINAIGMKARGERAPAREVVPALFEWEVDNPRAVSKKEMNS